MPYGMTRNEQGEWMFFNREYMPLGWNTTTPDTSIDTLKRPFDNLPIYTKYKGLGEKSLLNLGHNVEESVRRNDAGEIVKVFFYNDRTNPMNDAQYWPDYIQKIKALSKCQMTAEYA